MFMGLFGLFSKKKTAKTTTKLKAKTNYKGERLDRLTKEGKLPYGWYSANREFTEKIETEHRFFLKVYADNRYKSPKEWYAALKSLEQHTADVRKLCASKDECFVHWSKTLFGDKDYQDMKDELKYIKDHFDELDKKYRLEQHIQTKIIPELRKKLPKIIKQNPGILQTEVYKMFPDDYKDHISYELYKMCREEIIERVKVGRTYSLKMKK